MTQDELLQRLRALACRGGQVLREDNRFAFRTRDHRYTISFREPGTRDAADRGYLGCILTNRRPDPGEDWLRGRDLPDGPMNEDTWADILAGVLAWELEGPDPADKPPLAL